MRVVRNAAAASNVDMSAVLQGAVAHPDGGPVEQDLVVMTLFSRPSNHYVSQLVAQLAARGCALALAQLLCQPVVSIPFDCIASATVNGRSAVEEAVALQLPAVVWYVCAVEHPATPPVSLLW